jgi:hypothetical protein
MDKRILKRVDGLCTAMGITRVDVLCALLRAASEKHKAPEAPPPPNVTDTIMRVMRRTGSMTVREVRGKTASKRVRPVDWDMALHALCEAGEVRIAGERTTTGRTRRVVSLAHA